jgi:mannose-1-phosphate guanylyltransferase
MGRSVLEFWVWRLAAEGYGAAALNAYQGASRLEAEVRGRSWPIPVCVRTEPLLLGTGGGIRNLLDFFGDESFAVINGDIVCDASLGALHEEHIDSGAGVSLLLHDCKPFNNVAVDGGGAVLGFGEEARKIALRSPEVRLLAFTGIHFIDPDVVSELPPGEYADIIPLYVKRIRSGFPPRAVVPGSLFWREMGSVDAYRALTHEFPTLPEGFLYPLKTGASVVAAPGARVSRDARLKGVVVVGEGTTISPGCEIEDSILWDGVTVEPGARLRGCIVGDGVRVGGWRENEIVTEGGGNA